MTQPKCSYMDSRILLFLHLSDSEIVTGSPSVSEILLRIICGFIKEIRAITYRIVSVSGAFCGRRGRPSALRRGGLGGVATVEGSSRSSQRVYTMHNPSSPEQMFYLLSADSRELIGLAHKNSSTTESSPDFEIISA